MNKALKGNNEEIVYTKILNRKEKFWDVLKYDKDKTFAIHVINKKYGRVNEEKIQPKADVFFAKGFVSDEYLIKNNYYLDENDFEIFQLNSIPNSGLSIKLPNSNYTITKISPNTFYKIFGSNILAAGSSIYCSKEEEFDKNIDVLVGWDVDENLFSNYFSEKLKIESKINLFDKKTLEIIKTYSNSKISEIILSSIEKCNLIFKGIGNFEEPFTANWIIENDILKPNYYIPFTITTGSGRSKGIYTIVLKPR